VGREVLVGTVPGIVVGYNIASFGNFIGNAYPLVVRTALGVTKCSADELSWFEPGKVTVATSTGRVRLL
jgi:hypothetical protein